MGEASPESDIAWNELIRREFVTLAVQPNFDSSGLQGMVSEL